MKNGNFLIFVAGVSTAVIAGAGAYLLYLNWPRQVGLVEPAPPPATPTWRNPEGDPSAGAYNDWLRNEKGY